MHIETDPVLNAAATAALRAALAEANTIVVTSPDWLTCLCGNDPGYAGFTMCTADGTNLQYDADGNDIGRETEWDGQQYLCVICERIVENETGRILRGPTTPEHDRQVFAWACPRGCGFVEPGVYPNQAHADESFEYIAQQHAADGCSPAS